MFTLRHSEPRTVLLWGNRWYFPDREASEPFAHVTEAAGLIAARFANEPKPVRLRLLFQPESLRSVQVACPKGDRRVLAFALGNEFPALSHPDHAWGHEPVLANGEGFSTVLHYEAEPALITLATQLARLGLAVDSAWPLLTFLHALPDEWTDSGAVTVVAVSAQSGFAYHHPPDAPRSVVYWSGDSTPTDTGQWLRDILGRSPDEPILVVCDTEETAASLGSYLGDEERSNLDVIRVSEALGRRVVLPKYHPAQLLPREPVITAQRSAIAASIALLFTAGWAGFSFGHDRLAMRAEIESRQARTEVLRAEVSHLRANAAEIASARRLVEGGSGGPPCGALLRVLSTRTPRDIVLSGLQVDGLDIRAEGWVVPSAPAGLLGSWRQSVAQDAAWTFEVQPGNDGAFSASGVFRL